MKKLPLILGIIIAWVALGAYLEFSHEPKIALGAPAARLERSLIPELDSLYYLGTSTPSVKAWLAGYFDEICLTADTCQTTWPGGSGTPGGSNTQVQYNNSGTFGGDPGLVYNATTDTLTGTSTVFTFGTTTHATSTSLYTTKIGLNSELLTDFTGTGLQNTGNALTLNATGDWTGTIDGNNFTGGAVAAGDLLYGSGAGTIAELGIGTGGFILTSTGALPAWVATTSIPLGGDVTGTLSVTVVGNDSHDHTSATISGLDVSADLNLTGGAGLTLTGDDMACDTATSAVFGCLLAADWTVFNNKVSSTSIDTLAELETLQGSINIIQSTEIDTESELETLVTDVTDFFTSNTNDISSSELITAVSDETGSGSLVFSTLPVFSGFTSNASSSISSLSVVNGTTTNATTTNLVIPTSINLFGGGVLTTNNALCIQLTGAAGLCDGSDGGGAGSSNWSNFVGFITPSSTVGITVNASSSFTNLSVIHSTTTNATTTKFAISSMTAGSLLFASSSGSIYQDNANLFWDDTNNRLGISTTSPSALFSVGGNSLFGGTVTARNTLSVANAVGSTTFSAGITDTSGMIFSVATGTPIAGDEIYWGVKADGREVVKVGTNQANGTSTLSTGTVTVNNTLIESDSIIQLTLQNCSNCGTLSVGTKTANTSFVINSTNVLDASIVYWQIKKPNY